MTSNQNIMEWVRNRVQKGELTAMEGNVELVRAERYRLITCRMRAHVRKALNEAVKKGLLGHMKKSDGAPEVYYHPNFLGMAIDARRRVQLEREKAIAAVRI